MSQLKNLLHEEELGVLGLTEDMKPESVDDMDDNLDLCTEC